MARNDITTPFPIQTATLPDSLAGRDVLGRGRTGSGKTLAFALPVLTRLAAGRRDRKPGRPRALILAPTRELAIQIDAAIAPLAKPLGLRTTTVFGGVGQNPQVHAPCATASTSSSPAPAASRTSSARATATSTGSRSPCSTRPTTWPTSGSSRRSSASWTAPRATGQRMLFSATLDKGIDVLVKRYLTDPVTHSVDSEQSPVNTMAHHVLHVTTDDRLPVLVDLTSAPGRTMVFTRTKHRAKQLTRQLNAHGVPSVEMHGNLTQNVRTRNLAAFSDGRATVLVATDIAARGIHVDDVTLVIHADPPVEHKAYLHRSGRTARAGNDGTVVTLATEDQRRDVKDLARKAGIAPTVTVLKPGHPLLQELAPGQRTKRSAAEVAKAARGPGLRALVERWRRRSPSSRPLGWPELPQSVRSGSGSGSGSGSAGGGRGRSGGQGGRSQGQPSGSGAGRRSGPGGGASRSGGGRRSSGR